MPSDAPPAEGHRNRSAQSGDGVVSVRKAGSRTGRGYGVAVWGRTVWGRGRFGHGRGSTAWTWSRRVQGLGVSTTAGSGSEHNDVPRGRVRTDSEHEAAHLGFWMFWRGDRHEMRSRRPNQQRISCQGAPTCGRREKPTGFHAPRAYPWPPKMPAHLNRLRIPGSRSGHRDNKGSSSSHSRAKTSSKRLRDEPKFDKRLKAEPGMTEAPLSNSNLTDRQGEAIESHEHRTMPESPGHAAFRPLQPVVCAVLIKIGVAVRISLEENLRPALRKQSLLAFPANELFRIGHLPPA